MEIKNEFLLNNQELKRFLELYKLHDFDYSLIPKYVEEAKYDIMRYNNIYDSLKIGSILYIMDGFDIYEVKITGFISREKFIVEGFEHMTVGSKVRAYNLNCFHTKKDLKDKFGIKFKNKE